jgi:hypothetical protein
LELHSCQIVGWSLQAHKQANQTVVDAPYGTLKALRSYLQDAR